MVPLRSATTLLASPALISDCVPMIDRVRPAQLTTMVVSGSGAAVAARNTSSAPGTLTEPGMFMVVYSSKRRQHLRPARRGGGARLHQFAERLGVGVDVLKELIAGIAPGLQPARQRT